MKSIHRKVITIIYTIPIFISLLYTYDNMPWLWRKAISEVFELKLASSYYVFELSNLTQSELIVQIENLNDRKWVIMSSREECNRMKLDLINRLEVQLAPGQKELIVLPSLKYRHLGLICIFARTDWHYRQEISQQVATIFLSEDDVSAIHPDFATSRTVFPNITIEPKDLQTLSATSVDSIARRSADVFVSR